MSNQGKNRMINLCLPMKVINVTQHSGGSYSHPNYCLDLAGSDQGIDFAYALGNYWKCISGPWGSNTYFFAATDAKGNAVKVHCADGIDRVVTVALTHADFYYVGRPTIGKIYQNGEPLYEEGTHGQATGNHIHYEVAEGLQYGKYYDSSMGVYRMHGELKPESVCYICDSFSTVKSTGGVSFKHCAGVYTEDIYMEMKVGQNTYEYGDVRFTANLKADDAKFGLFNAVKGYNGTETMDIKQIDRKDVQFIEKCGNDMFQMKIGQSDPIGTVYGPRVCVGGPIVQPATSDKFLYYRIDKDGTVSYGDYNGGWIDEQWLKDNVQMVCSPQMIFCRDWTYPKYAPGFGSSSMIDSSWYQAFFGRNKDGKIFSGVSLTKVSAKKLWGIFREYFDIIDLAFMDGGSGDNPGSAQQIYWSNTKNEMIDAQYTGRHVGDILAFYRETSDVVIPPVQPDPEPTPTPEPEIPESPGTPIDNDIIKLLDKEFKKLQAELADANAEIERLHGIIDKAKEVLNDA